MIGDILANTLKEKFMEKLNDIPPESVGGITLDLLIMQVKFLHKKLHVSVKQLINNYNQDID